MPAVGAIYSGLMLDWGHIIFEHHPRALDPPSG
jgi:hypothetical protein